MSKQIIPVPEGAYEVVIETVDPLVSFNTSTSTTTSTTSTSSTTTTTTSTSTSTTSTTTSTTTQPPTTSTTSTTTTSTTTQPQAGYVLVLQSGYDKDSDIRNDMSQQAGRGVISTTNFKTGPGSFYSIPDNVSNGTRSEVQYTDVAMNPKEGALEYDVFYEVAVADGGHSFQIHSGRGGGGGTPSLWHDSGNFMWVNQDSQGGNTYMQTGVKIATGKWMHFRIEYKKSTVKTGAGAGYLRWYIDGVLKYQWTGQVGDGVAGEYLKIGFNGWDSTSPNSRIYYDNLKVYKK